MGQDNGITDFVIAGITYRRKRADDDIAPTRGQRFDVRVRGANESLLSSQSFVSLTASAIAVRTMPRGILLVARVDGGATTTPVFRELPPTIRFFAGGDNSVRGYAYQSLDRRTRRGTWWVDTFFSPRPRNSSFRSKASSRWPVSTTPATRSTTTAVICGNDVLAIGAIAEAAALGIAVPRELSITGFDDMEIASLFAPGVTTVHLPTAELGQEAARQLLARLAGEDVPLGTELPVELVVRGSTAAPVSAA